MTRNLKCCTVGRYMNVFETEGENNALCEIMFRTNDRKDFAELKIRANHKRYAKYLAIMMVTEDLTYISNILATRCSRIWVSGLRRDHVMNVR